MGLISLIMSSGVTFVLLVFMVIFIFLTAKWGKKRLEEISGRFDSELEQLQSKRKEYRNLEKEISRLKKRKEMVSGKEVKSLEKEIVRLQKKKDEIHEFIEENY